MKQFLTFIITAYIICTSTVLYAQSEQPMMGKPAPSFELKGLDGHSYSLAQWKGKVVMIHFATTWCPFCNAEAPNLEMLFQSYKEKGVQVLIVDVKESKD